MVQRMNSQYFIYIKFHILKYRCHHPFTVTYALIISSVIPFGCVSWPTGVSTFLIRTRARHSHRRHRRHTCTNGGQPMKMPENVTFSVCIINIHYNVINWAKSFPKVYDNIWSHKKRLKRTNGQINKTTEPNEWRPKKQCTHTHPRSLYFALSISLPPDQKSKNNNRTNGQKK